jgi:hypothetical protein
MDDCSVHVTDDARVSVLTFAPYPTQAFQVLDLILFDGIERRPRYELPFGHDDAKVKMRIKAYHNVRQTMVRSNIWRAVRTLGGEFEFETGSEPFWLLFEEEN